MDALNSSEFRIAAREFDDLERQHPYSPWARRSQVMAAYAYYANGDFDEAILTGERFLKLHPGNRDAAYAHYLIAMSYYDQITDVGRDQRITEKAVSALAAILKRYPDSDYARDAKFKLDLARDHLAGKEMEIGRFYLQRDQYTAAINRFRYVIENYGTTNHVPEALFRLTEAYISLGVNQEAQTAAAVLGHNYRGSKWYQRSYALVTGKKLEPYLDNRSWLSRIWSSIF